MQSENRVARFLGTDGSIEHDGSDTSNPLAERKPHLQRAMQVVERHIASRPGIAVAMGVSAGLIVGWIIKRR